MRLIDADALKEKAFFHEIDNVSYVEEEDIDKAPTVDAVERKRGKWVHSEDEAWSGGGKTTCSACAWSYSDGAYLDVYEFNFCPNCGAEMKER